MTFRARRTGDRKTRAPAGCYMSVCDSLGSDRNALVFCFRCRTFFVMGKATVGEFDEKSTE